MPTRKQRRRRQKERRHDYEIVYVDEEGQEVEVPPDAPEEARQRDGSPRRQESKQPAKRRNQAPVRQVQPPSWSRVGRRALLFFPLIFVAFSLVNRHQPLGTRFFITAVYTAFFVPFMYLLDRTMYRAFLKRSGQGVSARQGKRR